MSIRLALVLGLCAFSVVSGTVRLMVGEKDVALQDMISGALIAEMLHRGRKQGRI